MSQQNCNCGSECDFCLSESFKEYMQTCTDQSKWYINRSYSKENLDLLYGVYVKLRNLRKVDPSLDIRLKADNNTISVIVEKDTV